MSTDYKCVTEIGAVREYLAGHDLVSFDYETAPDAAYRMEEKAAPDPAKAHICTMSLSVEEHKVNDDLYLTVKKDMPFTLFTASGGTVNSSVAELDSSGRILTVYDNPVRTVTLTKLIDGGGEDTFNFKVTVFNSDGTTRLAGYTIGEKGGNALTTNNIGEVTLPMGDQESVALNIPHGSKITVEETQNSRYLASYTWNGSEAVESNVFGSDPVEIAANSTLVFTNRHAFQKLHIKKTGSDTNGEGLAGAAFDLTKSGIIEGFTNLINLTSMNGDPGSGNLGYLPGNDNTDNTLFVLPVGNYMLTETTEPQNYIRLEEGIGIIVGPDGITAGNNENASITGPDSDGVYTLTVMNIRKIDITLLKLWYAVPNTAPVQVQLYSTYDGQQGAPTLCGTYTLDSTGNWSQVAEGLPAHAIVNSTLKELKYYIVETGIVTASSGQTETVALLSEFGLDPSRYKAVPENGSLPDETINGFNNMSTDAANEQLSGSGTLVVGNRAPATQFAVNKKWYQLNEGYGWDDITGGINNLYITGELYRIVTCHVGSETRTVEQKVADVKYSNAGVVACESATGESISGAAEASWNLIFRETGVGNDGHPQLSTKGLWTVDGSVYPADYTYYFRETKLEERTGENTWLDVTDRWFHAYKDNVAHTETDLYNYRKSDLTIQKKWLPDASYGNGIQAVFFTVTDSAGENVGRLAYENPELYGLTSANVAKITLGSIDYYVVKLTPGASGWTGDEAVVIAGLTTSRPLVTDIGEISADSWPEVQYTVTEVAYTDGGGTHEISELTRPVYQSQIRKYNNGAWSNNGTTPPALQLGFNGDTKVRVSNTTAFDVTILKTGDDSTHGLANAIFDLYGSNYYESDGVTVNRTA